MTGSNSYLLSLIEPLNLSITFYSGGAVASRDMINYSAQFPNNVGNFNSLQSSPPPLFTSKILVNSSSSAPLYSLLQLTQTPETLLDNHTSPTLPHEPIIYPHQSKSLPISTPIPSHPMLA